MSTNVGKKRKTRENDHEEEEMEVERPITNISESLKTEFEESVSNWAIETESIISKYKQDVKDFTFLIKDRINLISESEEKLSDIESKMESNIQKVQSRIINLNIGGRLFSVSKETLMSIKGTYFNSILSSESHPTLPDGSYFIERNPEVFQRILDYFRTGELIIKDLSEFQLDLLKDDFDYYSMDLPEELLPPSVLSSWDESRKPNNATLSNNNLTVTRTGCGQHCGVIGSQAVDRYTFRIDDYGTVIAGFSTGASWDPNVSNIRFCVGGWFLNLHVGILFGAGRDNMDFFSTSLLPIDFNTGDYVTVIREGTTIRFQKNKVDLGVCSSFNNIPDQPLLPALYVCNEGFPFKLSPILTLVHDNEVEQPTFNTSETLNIRLEDLISKHSSETEVLTSYYKREVEFWTSYIVNDRVTLLSKKEKKLIDIYTKMESNIQKVQSRIINLNIGGRLFTVSKETLMSIKGTYFYGMLSSDRYPALADGSYFIDRNPKVFQIILDYLRTGNLICKDLSEYQLDLLKDDVDYYLIEIPKELQPVSSWDENRKPNNVTLSNNNLTVTKTSGSGRHCGVIGSQAVDRYTFRIDCIVGVSRIMVGFSTGASWEPNGLNFRKNGWFLCLYSGYLWGIGALHVPYTNEKFNTGDYVTVIREGTTIRLQKNKVDLGVCTPFTNVPDQPLLPALDIADENISLTLAHDY